MDWNGGMDNGVDDRIAVYSRVEPIMLIFPPIILFRNSFHSSLLDKFSEKPLRIM